MTKKIRSYSMEFGAKAVKKISENHGNLIATVRQLGFKSSVRCNV